MILKLEKVRFRQEKFPKLDKIGDLMKRANVLHPSYVWDGVRVQLADADEPREKTAAFGDISFADSFAEFTKCLGPACPYSSETCDVCNLNPNRPRVVKRPAKKMTVELHRREAKEYVFSAALTHRGRCRLIDASVKNVLV